MPSSSRQADWSSPRSSSKNYGESMLRLIWACGRPIQNEENIAVPSPQASAVFSNPKYRASPVQISEQNNAMGNRYSDVNSPALKICRPRPKITNSWKRGDLIAKGSFASVYRGYSNEDGIFFAVKGVSLTEPNHLPHLENEIAILKLLDDHENIIQYYGTHMDGEMVYIFLELASQGTLEQAYKKCRFKESQVSDYTRQILQGLKYLHSCNVVHGDLNCANILVTESGRIKLADFGCSYQEQIWDEIDLSVSILFINSDGNHFSHHKKRNINYNGKYPFQQLARADCEGVLLNIDYLKNLQSSFFHAKICEGTNAISIHFLENELHVLSTISFKVNQETMEHLASQFWVSLVFAASMGVEERIDIAESSIGNELIEQEGDGMVVEPHDGMEFESEDAAKIFFDE
ncbi:mitogen-activated protein kinase kinase kinase [Salix suchowensis]|nr:mitogen-activated protein kinase kinase kinase [Salix suchowensis]